MLLPAARRACLLAPAAPAGRLSSVVDRRSKRVKRLFQFVPVRSENNGHVKINFEQKR